MKYKKVENLFHLSKQRLNYLALSRNKRRENLNLKEIKMLVMWIKDQPIMEKNIHAKNIQLRLN